MVRRHPSEVVARNEGAVRREVGGHKNVIQPQQRARGAEGGEGPVAVARGLHVAQF